MKIQKYQIYSNNGIHICIVEAGYINYNKDHHCIDLYKDELGFNTLCTIPDNWCVIPVSAIIPEKELQEM
ncbi:MAG: hypothetical protein ABFD07_14175 [Methanobacterium sp.]